MVAASGCQEALRCSLPGSCRGTDPDQRVNTAEMLVHTGLSLPAALPSSGQPWGVPALSRGLEAPVVAEGLHLTEAVARKANYCLAGAAGHLARRAKGQCRKNLLAAVAVQPQHQALVLLQAAVETHRTLQ